MSDTQQSPHAANYMDDEIDLFELFEDIKEQWRWLIGSVITVTLAALVYALIATPTFQTEVIYRPATDADLYQLNQPKLKDALGLVSEEVAPSGAKSRTFSDLITADAAYKEFRSKALSSANLRAFYKKLVAEENLELNSLIFNPLLTEEQNTLRFASLFGIEDPKKGDVDVHFKVKFAFSSPVLAANILNQYSDFIVQRYEDEKKSTVENRIQAQLAQWRIQAEDLSSEYQANKTQRLLALKEAAAVAKSINQQRPLYDGERVALGVEPPLYMMGFKALESEIKQIEQRSNENSYIKGLPELLSKIARAEAAKIQWQQLKFIEEDQQAVTPLSPIKPKKKLIVAIGVVAGGMMGVFMALLVAAWKRRQKAKVSS